MVDIADSEIAEMISQGRQQTGLLSKIAEKSVSASKNGFDAAQTTFLSAVKSSMYGFEQMGGTTNKVVGALHHFTSSVENSSSLLKTFGNMFIGAGITGVLFSVMEKQVNAYRTLSDVGQTFHGSMIQLSQAASSAGLPLSMFAKVVAEQAAVFTNMGSVAFGDFQKGVMDATSASGNFGYSTEEMANQAGKYAETFLKTGTLSKQNNDKLKTNFINFQSNIQGYSSVFGTSRKEIMETVSSAMNQGVMLGKLTGMSIQEQEKMIPALQNSLAGLASIGGQAGKALTDIASEAFAQGTGVFAESSQAFIQTGLGAVVSEMENYSEKMNKNDPGAAFDAIKRSRDMIAQNEVGLRAQAASGSASAKQMLNYLSELNKINNMTREEFEQKQKDQKRLDGFNAGINALSNSFQLAVSNFYEALTKGIGGENGDSFKIIGEGLKNFGTWLGNGANVLAKFIASINNFIAKGIGDVWAPIVTAASAFFGFKLLGLLKNSLMSNLMPNSMIDTSKKLNVAAENLSKAAKDIQKSVGGSNMANMTEAMGEYGSRKGKKGIGSRIKGGLEKAGKMAGKFGGLGAVGAGMALDFAPDFKGKETVSKMLEMSGIGAQIGMMFGPLGGLIGGLAGAIGGVLYENWDSIKESLGKTWDTFGNWISSAWGTIKDLGFTILKYSTPLGFLYDGITAIADNWDSITASFSKAFNYLLDVFSNIWQTVNHPIDSLKNGIHNLIMTGSPFTPEISSGTPISPQSSNLDANTQQMQLSLEQQQQTADDHTDHFSTMNKHLSTQVDQNSIIIAQNQKQIELQQRGNREQRYLVDSMV